MATKQIHITMDETLHNALKIEAKNECTTVSALLSDFAREVKRKQKEENNDE